MKILDPNFIDSFVFVLIMLVYASVKQLKNIKNSKKAEKNKVIDNLIRQQIDLCKEQSDIMYNEFFEKYCELHKVSEKSIEGQLIELHLRKIRDFTDKEMTALIYKNKLASRKGEIWSQYKTDKSRIIMMNTQKHAKAIISNETVKLLGKHLNYFEDDKDFNFDKVFEKLERLTVEDTQRIYEKHIYIIFEIIRNEAVCFEETK